MSACVLHAVLIRASIAVKKHHGHGSSYKGKHLIGVVYILRGSVHCHHGGKRVGMQADMVLEK